MHAEKLSTPLPAQLWRARYLSRNVTKPPAPSTAARWDSVALAVSAAEEKQPYIWRDLFKSVLEGFHFLPDNQLMHAASTHRNATLIGCVAMETIEDSLHGIFNSLRESMVTLHSGANLAVDFSNIRPAQTTAQASGATAAGPVSFLPLWKEAAHILEAGHPLRGATAVAMRCDHPDIAAYIESHGDSTVRSHFKRTVIVSDAFMEAVDKGATWPLVFPLAGHPLPDRSEVRARIWPGHIEPQPCLVHKHVQAKSLWARLTQAQQTYGSPRVVFVDHMQHSNNLWYCEHISLASPDASVPLSPGAACNSGDINLTRFVRDSSTNHPDLDWAHLKYVTAIAVRFLDDVYDLSSYPLNSLERSAQHYRRIGIGITGLASMLAMLGLRYDSESSIKLTERIMSVIRHTAYRASAEIAREKGAFPAFDQIRYLASPQVLALSHGLQDAIAQHGIRNSHLLAIRSESSQNYGDDDLSLGIEPLIGPEGVSAEPQLMMASTVQSYVDNAVAVNLHVPNQTSATELGNLLQRAWVLRLKNCLVIRSL